MDVSENSGTPKSSILTGFSIINHPFWGTPIFWKHRHRHDIPAKSKHAPNIPCQTKVYWFTHEKTSSKDPITKRHKHQISFGKKRWETMFSWFTNSWWRKHLRFFNCFTHVVVVDMPVLFHKVGALNKTPDSFKDCFEQWSLYVKPTQTMHFCKGISDFPPTSPYISGWWFQPISQIYVKLDHFPK